MIIQSIVVSGKLWVKNYKDKLHVHHRKYITVTLQTNFHIEIKILINAAVCQFGDVGRRYLTQPKSKSFKILGSVMKYHHQ